MGVVSLVVMERGSEWPGHVGDVENLVAVGVGEERLLERTRHRIDLLRRGGQQVRIAVLACNAATDSSSAGCRAEVAHELLSSVAADAFGRVVLTSPERSSPRLRRELLSLVGALTDRLAGSLATVSVRFGAPANLGSAVLAPSMRKCAAEVWRRRLVVDGARS